MWTIADHILGVLRLKLRSQLRIMSCALRLARRRGFVASTLSLMQLVMKYG
jgi:hypothetical protein